MSKKEKQESSGEEVPAWIVSFSDMVTLLLAFFVLLQAFATTKSPDLFNAGQGSFERAIHGLGIPDLLLGKRNHDMLDWRRIQYPMEEDPQEVREQRIIDADEDTIRELFSRMRQDSYDLQAEDIRAQVRNVYPLTFRFEGKTAVLPAGGAQEIQRVAAQLRQYASDSGITIYVFGYCPDIADTNDSWRVSARRAQVVEAVLRKSLAHELQMSGRIRSVGSGGGDGWARRFNAAAQSQQIAIVVMQQ